ncbi:MAG TPA: hypothetical protein VIL74_07505 [Pyrinomonadaceae bacterium]|jgi:hypothetical protein
MRTKKRKFPDIAPKKGLVVPFPMPKSTKVLTIEKSTMDGIDAGDRLYFRTDFKLEDITTPTLCAVRVKDKYSIQYVKPSGKRIAVSPYKDCFDYYMPSEVEIFGVYYGKTGGEA